MNIKENSKNFIEKIFLSEMVERFFFSALCATVFTTGLCHWLLDITYKYFPAQAGKDYYVDFRWVFWAGAIISVYYLIRDYSIPKRNYPFDFSLAIFLQSMIFTGVIAYINSDFPTIPYTWILPIAYIVGKLCVGVDKQKANQRIEIVIYILMFALFITALLDFYSAYIYSKEVGFFPTEVWPGFWTNEEQNRCAMSLGILLVDTSLCFAIHRRKESPLMFKIVIVINIIGQLWAWKVESRTDTLLLLLSIIIYVVMLCIDNREKVFYQNRKKFFYFIIGLLIGIVTLILAFINNWFGLKTFYYESQWGYRLVHNVRIEMLKKGFAVMLQTPFGKLEPPDDPLSRAHDSFMEYGRIYGITVLLGIEISRFIALKNALLLTINRNKYSWIKHLLVPAFISLNLYYSSDPNGYAQRYLWMIGLLVAGMMRGWLDVNED